jgi:hypothetical protein
VASSGLTWQGMRPMDFLRGIDAYAQRIERAAERVAATVATAMEEYAQEHAPWTDRSGKARETLHAHHAIAGTILRIYLSHGMDYGLFLEKIKGATLEESTLRRSAGPVAVETVAGGNYAIIWPTIERYMDTIYDQIRQELG